MNKRVFLALFAMLFMASNTHLALAEKGGGSRGKYASEIVPPAPIPDGHFALLAHYANEFLSANDGTGGHRTLFAETLMDDIDDPEKADEITDFYLIDIRSPTDYAAGHIAGAVNVPLGGLASPESLATLPTDAPILIICYTGHTASIANAILGTLGYDAWTLRFGMTSWRATTSMAVWSANVKQDIDGADYPMVTGTEP